jgi:hypothetical protein
MNQQSDAGYRPNYSCVACGSLKYFLVGSSRVIDPTSDDEFEIRSCSECNHWDTSPLPSAETLGGLYAEGSLRVLGEGWAHNYASGQDLLTVSPDYNWIVQRMHSDTPQNFLEIGPGDGSLIRKFRLMGWNSYGVDPGQYLDDELIVDDARALPSNMKFQLIVLQDILEHTSNPWEELAKYKHVLSAGSRIFMTFPWSESKEARKLGSNWAMVRPVGHLHYFSISSTKNLLASIGAELVDIQVINLMPSKIRRIKNLLWLLATLPLQYFRRGVRKNPYRQRLALLRQTWISFTSQGDQLYVEGRVI